MTSVAHECLLKQFKLQQFLLYAVPSTQFLVCSFFCTQFFLFVALSVRSFFGT
jgi:hypothetical protein